MEREITDLGAERFKSLHLWWENQKNRANYRNYLLEFRRVSDGSEIVFDWLMRNIEGINNVTIVDEDLATNTPLAQIRRNLLQEKNAWEDKKINNGYW